MAAIRRLGQNIELGADKTLQKTVTVCLADVAQTGRAFLAFGIGDGRHAGGGRAGAFAVREDMQEGDLLLFDKGAGLFEQGIRFRGKARDQIGANACLRAYGSNTA